MQPETATIPQTKFGQHPSGDKKDLAAVEQWDMVAFKLIQDILAPKGFKEVKNGTWRGLKIANALEPGLIKDKVNLCQKTSAQLVRSYRIRAKGKVNQIISELDTWIKDDQTKLAACQFWEFSKKTELKYKIRSLHGQAGSAQRILNELDNIGIK